MENIVKVFVANVPTDIPYKEKIVNLSNDAKQRLNNSTNNFERNKIILQERLLRYGLNQMSAQLPEILEIHRTKYGKPYLTNVGGLYFNISHSGNLIAMAIARCPVGIDIEIGKNADVEVAYSFFHDDEIEKIAAGETDEERNRLFLKTWCRKEAYSKCVGKGLMIPLKSYNVYDIKFGGRFWDFSCDEYNMAIFTRQWNNMTVEI